MKSRNALTILCGLLTVASLSACARTTVRPGMYTQPNTLTRPQRVLVYPFAVSESEVKENQSMLSHAWNGASGTTELERAQEIGHQAAQAYAEDLVAGIKDLGMAARINQRGDPVPSESLMVVGKFLNVDEGNRLRRLVIGFGAGGSQLDAQVGVYYVQGGNFQKLVEFSTHADSGQMPGAAVTLGAGAAAQGGVTAGAAVANAGVAGVKVYRSDMEQMAGRSAEQAAAYLSEYFAKQGWIAPSDVKRAKRLDE
ncbi:MAG TPA: DUF4410 domain-containing protein [Candidatus Acidoferrales bacterium]|nr:DUF4410 domain-containing protein [Candidatus Acidoferrales bacterium]